MPGTHTYDHGAEVTVTADPDAGYVVSRWSEDCGGSVTTCTLTMNADKSTSVTFEEIFLFHTLTVNVSGGGTASGAGTYRAETVARVTATDTDDWAFVRWEGDISSTSRSATVLMDSNKTVTAVFIFECDVIGCRRDEGQPAAPGSMSVRLANETFTVSWDAMSGADRYRVQYRNDPGNDWTELVDADPTDTVVTWSPESIVCGATYTFQVEARGDGETYTADWGLPETRGVVTTGCELQPVFGSSDYEFSVAEGAEVGTVVGQVAATPDADLSYAITAGNAGGAFAIGAASGEITLAGTLDSSALSSYTLAVRASDGRGGVATATVALTVVE